MTTRVLADEIGVTTLDHVAFFVRRGMFIGAKAFFVEQLRWVEVRNASGSGWRAVFLKPTSTSQVCVQLTEEDEFSDAPVIFPGAHLGIMAKNAEDAASLIERWADRAGLECVIEPANQERTKWFVRIPELFTFSLELITAA